MHYVIPANRQQITFIQSLDDLVPLDHYVRLIDALVDAIVSANPERFIYKDQKNSGRRAYNPITMLKLLLYGYLNSIKTSRTLERECHRNIEVIWLLGDLKPDHKSIAEYHKVIFLFFLAFSANSAIFNQYRIYNILYFSKFVRCRFRPVNNNLA